MKESRYNISVIYNGEHLMFNSRTIATAALDRPALDILDTVRQGNEVKETDLVKEMKRVGFLVDDATDELQQLEMNYNLGKYEKSGLGLVIAPTMACNFACPYCFEGTQKGIMSKELQKKIISMASNFAKNGQNINITWFGGEPLLAKKTIYSMSEQLIEICLKENVDYEAGMVTNGYLLDEETVQKLREYKVTFIQITLDGLPKTHNQKRKLINNSGEPTFDRIVENILLVKSQGICTSIRINVDKETEGELEQLLELMMEKKLGENLYLGHVEANTDCSKECSENCLSAEEFARTYVNYEKLLFSKKMQTDYPAPTRINCGADYLYSFVIDAGGDMYKCLNDIGIKKNSIGNIEDLEDFSQLTQNPNRNYTKYITWSPFDFKKCRECNILPICMGGCQYNGREAGEPICESWKYEIEEYIKLKCDAFE